VGQREREKEREGWILKMIRERERGSLQIEMYT
jgi:hypothetical protein